MESFRGRHLHGKSGGRPAPCHTSSIIIIIYVSLTILGIDDLSFVYDAIKNDLKAKWNDFGLSLGIRFPDLEVLEDHKGKTMQNLFTISYLSCVIILILQNLWRKFWTCGWLTHTTLTSTHCHHGAASAWLCTMVPGTQLRPRKLPVLILVSGRSVIGFTTRCRASGAFTSSEHSSSK